VNWSRWMWLLFIHETECHVQDSCTFEAGGSNYFGVRQIPYVANNTCSQALHSSKRVIHLTIFWGIALHTWLGWPKDFRWFHLPASASSHTPKFGMISSISLYEAIHTACCTTITQKSPARTERWREKVLCVHTQESVGQTGQPSEDIGDDFYAAASMSTSILYKSARIFSE